MQNVTPPVIHPLLWTEEDWLTSLGFGRSYLLLEINDQVVVIHPATQSFFDLSKMDDDLFQYFAELLKSGTSHSYNQAMELKAMLLRNLPKDLINQIEQDMIDTLIASKLIH